MSKDTISRITDKVIAEMTCRKRTLEPVYPVMFIDAIGVKIRDGQVGERYVLAGENLIYRGHFHNCVIIFEKVTIPETRR